MISEVPHMSQEFCCWRSKQHHFVSIIPFLVRASFRSEVGHDSAGKRGTIPLKWGNLGVCPVSRCQSISVTMVVR
jgi:hypothetical protein